MEGLEEAAAAGLRPNGMRWPMAAALAGEGGAMAVDGGAEQSYEELCRCVCGSWAEGGFRYQPKLNQSKSN